GELGQGDAQVAQELAGHQDVPEVARDLHRTGQQQRAHAPTRGGEEPEHDQHDQEGQLHRPAAEAAVAPVPSAVHGAAPAPLIPPSAMVLRISSCRSAYSRLRMVVNFSEVTKSGLRGCGSSTAMISLMVPGRAENTATRSARKVASPRLWVTNTMVLPLRASS